MLQSRAELGPLLCCGLLRGRQRGPRAPRTPLAGRHRRNGRREVLKVPLLRAVRSSVHVLQCCRSHSHLGPWILGSRNHAHTNGFGRGSFLLPDACLLHKGFCLVAGWLLAEGTTPAHFGFIVKLRLHPSKLAMLKGHIPLLPFSKCFAFVGQIWSLLSRWSSMVSTDPSVVFFAWLHL